MVVGELARCGGDGVREQRQLLVSALGLSGWIGVLLRVQFMLTEAASQEQAGLLYVVDLRQSSSL